jgi:TusA-related sulfurtransferase
MMEKSTTQSNIKNAQKNELISLYTNKNLAQQKAPRRIQQNHKTQPRALQ